MSTMSATKTGLDSSAAASLSLSTNLANTVASIQDVDQTALQAKLQQLNNQQSIDYYLISQMNTAAQAALTIFR
jgi:flagellin-like hook-associated protein FlgL